MLGAEVGRGKPADCRFEDRISGSPMPGAPRELVLGQCLLPHRDGAALPACGGRRSVRGCFTLIARWQNC
jgi:hypothetical protein